jgi:single-strand DNA-binding protein
MSFSLNRATIIGNITRDPEPRTTTSGQQVVSFGVATSRRWKDKQSGELKEMTEFHNCVAWARLAQTVTTYCRKGSKVYVEGRLQTRSWDDPTGVKKYRTEIISDNVILLDRKGEGPAATAAAPAGPADQAAQPAPAPSEDEINIEDIPF